MIKANYSLKNFRDKEKEEKKACLSLSRAPLDCMIVLAQARVLVIWKGLTAVVQAVGYFRAEAIILIPSKNAVFYPKAFLVLLIPKTVK